MHYQLFTWLPWWFKRYVLRQKDAVLPLLYHFDQVERVDNRSDTETILNRSQKEEKQTAPEAFFNRSWWPS